MKASAVRRSTPAAAGISAGSNGRISMGAVGDDENDKIA
jgi:hypothetical protein